MHIPEAFGVLSWEAVEVGGALEPCPPAECLTTSCSQGLPGPPGEKGETGDVGEMVSVAARGVRAVAELAFVGAAKGPPRRLPCSLGAEVTGAEVRGNQTLPLWSSCVASTAVVCETVARP